MTKECLSLHFPTAGKRRYGDGNLLRIDGGTWEIGYIIRILPQLRFETGDMLKVVGGAEPLYKQDMRLK